MRLSATPPVDRTAPPRRGEHTPEVLQERLGIDQIGYEELKQAGILR